MRRCEAPAGEIGGPRCGAPATYATPLGDRCDKCIELFRQAARSPSAFINVLLGRARTEEEIKQMVRSIASPRGQA